MRPFWSISVTSRATKSLPWFYRAFFHQVIPCTRAREKKLWPLTSPANSTVPRYSIVHSHLPYSECLCPLSWIDFPPLRRLMARVRKGADSSLFSSTSSTYIYSFVFFAPLPTKLIAQSPTAHLSETVNHAIVSIKATNDAFCPGRLSGRGTYQF